MQNRVINALNTMACNKTAKLLENRNTTNDAFLTYVATSLRDNTAPGAYEVLMIAYVHTTWQIFAGNEHEQLMRWYKNFLVSSSDTDFITALNKHHAQQALFAKSLGGSHISGQIYRLIQFYANLIPHKGEDAQRGLTQDITNFMTSETFDQDRAFEMVITYDRAYALAADLYYVYMSVSFEIILDRRTLHAVEYFFRDVGLYSKKCKDQMVAYIQSNIGDDASTFAEGYVTAEVIYNNGMKALDHLQQETMKACVAYCEAWHTKKTLPAELGSVSKEILEIAAEGDKRPVATPAIHIVYTFTKKLHTKEQRNPDYFQALSQFIEKYYTVHEKNSEQLQYMLQNMKGNNMIRYTAEPVTESLVTTKDALPGAESPVTTNDALPVKSSVTPTQQPGVFTRIATAIKGAFTAMFYPIAIFGKTAQNVLEAMGGFDDIDKDVNWNPYEPENPNVNGALVVLSGVASSAESESADDEPPPGQLLLTYTVSDDIAEFVVGCLGV